MHGVSKCSPFEANALMKNLRYGVVSSWLVRQIYCLGEIIRVRATRTVVRLPRNTRPRCRSDTLDTQLGCILKHIVSANDVIFQIFFPFAAAVCEVNHCITPRHSVANIIERRDITNDRHDVRPSRPLLASFQGIRRRDEVEDDRVELVSALEHACDYSGTDSSGAACDQDTLSHGWISVCCSARPGLHSRSSVASALCCVASMGTEPATS